MKVAVLGAGGFVGRALLQQGNGIDWVAVQRGEPSKHVREHCEWRSCDLLDPVQAEIALAGVDVAVFLVHSMAPRGIELQGDFQDIDALIALNVAEAARLQGVKRIVYLGGLLPPNDHLSPHLESRLEVETILRSAGCPVISLRAGIVIGAEGSSFEMMSKLVRRLPLMLVPAWTSSRTEAIALDDVIKALLQSIRMDVLESRVFDLGSGEVMTYWELMKETASLMNVKRNFLRFPGLSPRLSVLWVSLITGAKAELVKPLVQSLLEDMLPHNDRRFPFQEAPLTLKQALLRALDFKKINRPAPRKRAPQLPHWGYQTRIVNRLPYLENLNELQTGRAYFHWLGKFVPGFVRVRAVSADNFRIYFGFLPKAFLILNRHPEQERPGLAVFEIEKGLLVRQGDAEGPESLQSFSFRRSREAQLALGIIENYSPWLPRWTYRWTQALAHGVVMRLFARYLSRRYHQPVRKPVDERISTRPISRQENR